MAEWLRRRTANAMGYSRACSNHVLVAKLFALTTTAHYADDDSVERMISENDYRKVSNITPSLFGIGRKPSTETYKSCPSDAVLGVKPREALLRNKA